MSNETTKNPPVDTLRDGGLKAAIWANPVKEGEGIRYSVSFTRSYRDKNDQWHDTQYFGSRELLPLAHLAARAYDRISELRAAEQPA